MGDLLNLKNYKEHYKFNNKGNNSSHCIKNLEDKGYYENYFGYRKEPNNQDYAEFIRKFTNNQGKPNEDNYFDFVKKLKKKE
jgi:hypothetical protein